MSVNLEKILSDLAKIRPIFHSEADFQHALAWQIHHELPDCSMRLEFKPPGFNEKMYLDLWVSNKEEKFAIELKYKTRRLNTQINNESFTLLDQSAQDIARYDFLKDIVRLERVITKNNASGYAVFLTNDSAYWKQPASNDTVDSDFRIHQGKFLSSNCSWGKAASVGTTKGREQQIELKGKYHLYWKRYSSVVQTSYGAFNYLLVRVN